MQITKKTALYAALYIALVYLAGNLLLNYFAPYGKSVTNTFVNNLPGAETFTSLNKEDGKLELGGILLKTKSTRFSIKNIKDLNNVAVHLAYKPGQKEIKLGVRSNESDPFVYKSLFFDPINSLTWEKVEQDGLVLYQKEKTFDNVTSYLTNIPTDKKLATYQLDTNQLVPTMYPKSATGKTIIATPIRGNATAYVLVTGGDLSLKVTKQDINMYEGNDALNITVSLAGTKVTEATVADDGFADKSKSQSAPQVTTVEVKNAKPGVYKVDFKFDSAGGDSVLTKLEFNQTKVVFGGSALLWNATPTTIYTMGQKVTTSTSWPESIQNLKVDDKADLAIKDIKNKFSFDLGKMVQGKPEGELYKVFSPKGNVNLGTDGYMAFSKDAYFDPTLIKATPLTTADAQADIENTYDYILTTVAPAREVDYWLNSDLVLKAADMPLAGDKLFFELAIPEIDKQGGSLEIGGFNVTLNTK
jgi:hypothetical protein